MKNFQKCFTHYIVIQSVSTLYGTCMVALAHMLLRSLILDFLFAVFLCSCMDVTHTAWMNRRQLWFTWYSCDLWYMSSKCAVTADLHRQCCTHVFSFDHYAVMCKCTYVCMCHSIVVQLLLFCTFTLQSTHDMKCMCARNWFCTLCSWLCGIHSLMWLCVEVRANGFACVSRHVHHCVRTFIIRVCLTAVWLPG